MNKEMNRRNFLHHASKGVISGIAGIPLLTTIPGTLMAAKKDENEKPNIVFVFTDDLGWTGLGCYGNKFPETPNIDKMCEKGMKFTDAYSTPICGPSRACLYSGQNVTTTKYWNNGNLIEKYNRMESIPFLQPPCNKDYHKGIDILPEHMKKAGYKTAFLGKTHMIYEEHYDSIDYYVDQSQKGWGKSHESFKPAANVKVPAPKKGQYLNDYLTDRALDFIDLYEDDPFFLYFSVHLPHTPVQADPKLVQKYKKKKGPNVCKSTPGFAGMIETMDKNVGRIIDKIKEKKLSNNTLIIFTSDNGGQTGPKTMQNTPLKEGKGRIYEGGIRVPLIAMWDGVIEKGSECNDIVHTIDFYPTLSDVAKVERPKHKLEGLSLLPILKDAKADLGRDEMYWHYPGYSFGDNPRVRPRSAVRSGRYKLIENLENQSLELYDLEKDIGENNNLAKKKPAKRKELLKKLHDWRKETDAPMLKEKG